MAVEATPDERDAVVRRLRAAGCVFAEDEAWLVLKEATSPAHLEDMVARRCEGVPLEQVVGFAEFCGVRVHLEPGVFVPRQRTQLLVRAAASVTAAGDLVLDLCCGSGAVGAALHAAVPGAEVCASDVEPAAVRCARRNLEPLGGRVFEGDLFEALPESLHGQFATIAVNAPYVPTGAIALMPPEARDHEPHLTLDGGADGVDVHRRVAADASVWLRPGGRVLVETSRDQQSLTASAFAGAGLVTRLVESAEVGTTVVVGTLPA